MKILPLLAVSFAFVMTASAADSTVVFNEIQYNPVAGQQEFIELRNLNGVDVHLGGWKIDGGVDFTVPAGTVIAGGGYVLIGALPGALGPFAGQLSNSGETLRLRNLNGRIMDEVTYDDKNGWPTGADGSGASLSRRTASAASGPEAWTASTTLGGTPGAQNFYEGAASVRTITLPIGATWKYEDSGTTPPVDWQTAAFNDASWKSGATLITGGGGKLANGVKPSAFPSGLLAYWAFDETSGTVAANTGTAGQPNGTMANGAAFVADAARGQVASFDGVDDRMEVIDSGTGLPTLTLLPAMTAANDFTWAAWVWSSTASTLADQSGAVILGNRTNPNGLDTTPREYIKIMPTAMQYHRNTVTENLDYPDLATSAWTHMCVVKRGLNLDYYKNGVFVQTKVVSAGLINTALPFYVGGDRKAASSTEHFAGRVDDVGLWTRALSAVEVAQLGGTYGAAPTLPTPPEQTTNAVTGPEPRFFRKTFTFTGASGATTLELWPVADDGAVVYLNGIEVYRNNVPPAVEVGDSRFPTTPVVIANAALVNGTNVLSAEVHQFSGGNNDLLFGAELAITSVPGPAPASPASLTFSEITGASDANFYIELRNTSGAAVSTSGWSISTTANQSAVLAAQNIAAGDYLVLNAAALGFTPGNGVKLFLLAPGAELRDAREVTGSLRGLLADGSWGYPTSATPGAANIATISTDIVINEIFYHAPGASLEQWIELHNRSGSDVNVGGWKISGGAGYDFPENTMIPAGGFLVVSWNPAAFSALHLGVNSLGPLSGSLSGGGDTISLRDANGNVANQVTYSDGGRWSQWADGGGSSLELIDPDADNSKGEAWNGSDESTHSTWQNVSISGTAVSFNPANNPTTWNEFLFGLLNAGEMLIDDISVKDVTQGNVELIQNGTFSGGTANFWRIIGTHSGSVVDDPLSPGSKVLKVVSTAETEHMHNHAGTTLKNGAAFHTIVATDTYNITFRAKWLRGSNLLHSRLYMNRLPFKTVLNRPATGGTPGARNGRYLPNIGPTFDALAHSPAVPPVIVPATITVKVMDPDGVASVQLFTSINGAAFTSSAMTPSGGGIYTGTVGGQSAGTVVQFYIRATDTPGFFSFYPAGGAASRAMIQWDDGRAALTLASGAKPHNIRVIMPGADANNLYRSENLMSNASIPCTVIYDEREIYYRAGVALKSSEHGRFNITRVGYNIEFPPDDLFLGAHGGIAIDRSGGGTTGQKEILLKTLSILAGGIHAPQDDIIRLIPARATGTGFAFDGAGMLGAAILSKTRLKGDYLGSQWDNGSDGMMFKYERIYVLTETINPTTRVVDTGIVPENPKIPQDTTSPPGVNVTNLGANSEFYRWHWLVESGRDTDDYTGIMKFTNAVGQAAGATFNTLTAQYIDVDEWLRAHVPSALFGVTDNYMAPTGSSQHNTLIYFPPGKKAVIFPWDCDFLSQVNPTTTSLTGGGDLAKFINNPLWKRLYYGHILDILNRSFNTATMTAWATHYQRFGTDEMVNSSVVAYLTPRAQYARDVVTGTNGQTAPIPFVAFARTSASPATVSTPFATVTGVGWINLAEIRLLGSAEPLAITWTSDTAWTLQLPIAAGTNTYTLVPYDSNGVQLTNAVSGGTPVAATVTVTGNGGIFPAGPGNLVVSELNYNPAGSTEATEFIELLNITSAALDLGGCHFDEELGQGIAYTFPVGVQVAAGARIVVARNRAAFLAMYPSVTNLAPNQYDPSGLDNGGESLVLYSAGGLEIFRFTYTDSIAATDDGGRSLVRVLSSTNPNTSTYVWRASTQDGGNPGASDALAFTGSPLADLDGDGISALVEYACGSSDNDPASRPAPAQFAFDFAGNVNVTFPIVPNADDVICTIETTTTTTLGSGWVPLNGPIAAGANRFFRLRVTPR